MNGSSRSAHAKPIAAVIATVLWGPGFFVGLFMTAMGAMMFDAPGSGDVVWTKLLFASVASGPVLCVISVLSSWIAWFLTGSWAPGRGNWLRGALAALPVLWVIFVVIALVLLEVKCGGTFNCKR